MSKESRLQTFPLLLLYLIRDLLPYGVTIFKDILLVHCYKFSFPCASDLIFDFVVQNTLRRWINLVTAAFWNAYLFVYVVKQFILIRLVLYNVSKWSWNHTGSYVLLRIPANRGQEKLALRGVFVTSFVALIHTMREEDFLKPRFVFSFLCRFRSKDFVQKKIFQRPHPELARQLAVWNNAYVLLCYSHIMSSHIMSSLRAPTFYVECPYIHHVFSYPLNSFVLLWSVVVHPIFSLTLHLMRRGYLHVMIT